VPISKSEHLRWLVFENNKVDNLWPLYNLQSLTDIMLYDNPINHSEEIASMNKKVIEKITNDGKNINQKPSEVNSIYGTEPSKSLK